MLCHSDLKAGFDPVAWVNSNGLLLDKAGNPARLDGTQESILRSAHKRMIINCHRQFGKSQMSSFLCLHRAIYYPRSLCLLVAPSLRQSSENFRKVLDALNIGAEGPDLEENTKLTLKLANQSRIIALPGTQRTIRGFSAPDLIVIDEDAQSEDELFEAVYPMLTSNPAGRMILASTPWLRSGHFYKLWTGESNGWQKIRIRASENPRIDPTILEEAKLQLSPSAYARDFECEFTEAEGAVFSSELFKSLADPALKAMTFTHIRQRAVINNEKVPVGC
jgi:hypothetical protein